MYELAEGESNRQEVPRLKKRARRPARRRQRWPELTIEQILAWADAYRTRHGRWPPVQAGPIEEANGETWRGVEAALRMGLRGLPESSSLHKLIRAHRPG